MYVFDSDCPDPADGRVQWKVLVIDEGAKKILDNVVKEDDILNENIASTWHTWGEGTALRLYQISKGSRKDGT